MRRTKPGAMTRRTDAAFSAFAGLDPVRAKPGEHDAPCQRAAVPETDLSIARITAVPREGRIDHRRVARALPRGGSRHRQRSRLGALGLAASAGLAVLATLLWVSPSAGSPNRIDGTLSAVGAGHGVTSSVTPHTGHDLAGGDAGTAGEPTGPAR
jgi:hypothetical protein